MSPRFRPELAQIPSYKAGQGPLPREDDLVPYKVSSNENPFDPLPSVVSVIEQSALFANRYPDPGSTALIDAIAQHHQVPAEHVAVGTGAVALCYQFAHATSGAGEPPHFELGELIVGYFDGISWIAVTGSDALPCLSATMKSTPHRKRKSADLLPVLQS